MSDHRKSAEADPEPLEVAKPLGGRRRGGSEEVLPEPFFERESPPGSG